ncbi:beta-lactamase/transpeptidase-like protein [Chiua virens]|nr:beta-lactamase/transpeptidase-like protein [Chiua virens]
MAFYLAVGIGLVAWSLVSYNFPNLLSQIPLNTFYAPSHKDASIISPQLSTFIRNTLALENINGLSVAVISKEGEPEYHSWGHRTEDGDQVTPDTLFHMASVSKAFCATALGLLIEDFANGNNVTALPSGVAELTWHTRLKDLLPEWELMDEWASERANLRDILSHVSGMPRHDASYGPLDTPLTALTRLKYLRPAFELREQWSYNNIMYMVASHVIATYSGQPYTSFVEERVFSPLGMTSSTFSPTKAEAFGKFTQGWSEDGRRIPECFDENMAFMMAGTGGIISNAVDMAKWVSTWISEGVYDNRTIIPLSVYRNVSYSYSVATDHPTNPGYSIVGYGMGWLRSSYRGHDVVYHTGSLPGLSTLVVFLPTDEIGVTLFANGDNKADSLMLMLNRILDSALRLKSPPTHTKSPSPGDTVTQPSAQNLTLSLDALAGTYTDPGYGSLTLCSPFSASAYCGRVQSKISTVRGDPNTSANDLVAEWPRVWSSHVHMRHQRDLLFELYFSSLYPDGYGKDTTPFEVTGVGPAGGLAEFVVEDGRVVGFGVSGLVGQLTERERTGTTVRDGAEVWFDKEV